MVRKTLLGCARHLGKVSVRPGAATFRIDKAFTPSSSDLQNAAALATLLACLCQLNGIWLLFHPLTPPLYATSVYYQRTEVWDTIPALYQRGYGDCKSLTAVRVPELRRGHIWARPVFRFKELPEGTMYHILIMFQDGTWEDPSKFLGMEAGQEWEMMPHQ